MRRFQREPQPGEPPFTGGLVGHLGWETVAHIEPKVPVHPVRATQFPKAFFFPVDTLVAFDNVKHEVHLVAQATRGPGTRPDTLYADAQRRIGALHRQLTRGVIPRLPKGNVGEFKPLISSQAYLKNVAQAKAAIAAGDNQQIVVSQKFEAQSTAHPFSLYRALRRVNPSPYLFYLKDNQFALSGSSPERLVQVKDGEITVRPIAGTRPRAENVAEDAKRHAELLADEKENAEHVMLVDLGRNDVGRVAEIGSVKVTDFRKIETYSHVSHMVSEVRGRLAHGLDAVDALRSTFPAGTLSGAPKVKAMEWISRLEGTSRGAYGGAVGHIDYSGDLEMAIVIRTFMCEGRRVTVQAGAGIVHDSSPQAELQETYAKAGALMRAAQLLKVGA